MIKKTFCPISRFVTFAALHSVQALMIIITAMASDTLLFQRIIKFAGHMAVFAGNLIVFPFQGKFGFTGMIKRRVVPGTCLVASLAGCAILAIVTVIDTMTGVTVLGHIFILLVDMT